MSEIGKFRCLRCGHEYEDKYIPGVPQERACPKCSSNSVRRIEEKKVNKT
jgi:predicted  nucleic acid-binding Zn-ribbon protein